MPKINEVIPPFSAELIQDRVKAILADELPNQATLTGNAGLDAKVMKDRLTPPGQQEFPLVSVIFNRINFQSRSQVHTVGDSLITIQIYTSAKQTPSQSGGEVSSAQNRAIARTIRGILEAPVYKKLDFSVPFIQHLSVASYSVVEPEATREGTFLSIGRLDFNVEAADHNVLQASRELEGLDSVTKLNETDKGQKRTLEQT